MVANSRYMGIRAQRKFGVKPIVVCPLVDARGLSQVDMPPPEERRYILMVGHEELKGVSVFKRIEEGFGMVSLEASALGVP